MTEAAIRKISLRKHVVTAAETTANRNSQMANPLVWLGAKSPFGIALPDAKPSASQMYAPRGVFFNDDYLVAADSGNHRVLIWNGIPAEDGAPADIVLGQPDFNSEGPRAGGKSTEAGFHLPTGVRIIDRHLFLADSWNHRILVWNEMPTRNFQPPDFAIGQPDLMSVTENQGRGKCSADTLYWCYGFNYINGIFYVADTGNRRVLGWHGLPESNRAADFVIGQDDFETNLENRGLDQTTSGRSFRWIHDIAGDESRILFADAGNHRVLGWNGTLDSDRHAEIVLGQENYCNNGEFPYIKQGASRLRFPYSVSLDGDMLAVADTSNNRVLFWKDLPETGEFIPANGVAGQPGFDDTGENRWQLVGRDTLCWVYGIHFHGDRLAVADSGNNRVMIWRVKR